MNDSRDRIMAELKTPPNSREAEQAVLGALLISDEAFDLIAGKVLRDDFYYGDHRLLFESMSALAKQGKPRDVVTLSEWLDARGQLERAGGMVYLGTLAKDTPSAANVEAYAAIVHERSLLRAAIRETEKVQTQCYAAGGITAQEIIDGGIKALMALSKTQANHHCTIAQALEGALMDLDEAVNSGGALPGVTTGLSLLDAMIGGWQKTDLVVVGARPSIGKTSVMLNFTANAYASAGIFSTEQGRNQLGGRFLSMGGNVSHQKMRTADLEQTDWNKLMLALQKFKDRSIFINDHRSASLEDIIRQARKWKQEYDLRLLFVDYIQHIGGDKRLPRHEQIDEIVRGLKNTAGELDITVIALAQVNREVEKRPDKRPHIADLKDSGSIEQEADQILLLYRDEVYDEETREPGVMEIMIGKNRHGPIGMKKVAWLGDTMMIKDLDTRYEHSQNSGPAR